MCKNNYGNSIGIEKSTAADAFEYDASVAAVVRYLTIFFYRLPRAYDPSCYHLPHQWCKASRNCHPDHVSFCLFDVIHDSRNCNLCSQYCPAMVGCGGFGTLFVFLPDLVRVFYLFRGRKRCNADDDRCDSTQSHFQMLAQYFRCASFHLDCCEAFSAVICQNLRCSKTYGPAAAFDDRIFRTSTYSTFALWAYHEGYNHEKKNFEDAGLPAVAKRNISVAQRELCCHDGDGKMRTEQTNAGSFPIIFKRKCQLSIRTSAEHTIKTFYLFIILVAMAFY